MSTALGVSTNPQGFYILGDGRRGMELELPAGGPIVIPGGGIGSAIETFPVRNMANQNLVGGFTTFNPGRMTLRAKYDVAAGANSTLELRLRSYKGGVADPDYGWLNIATVGGSVNNTLECQLANIPGQNFGVVNSAGVMSAIYSSLCLLPNYDLRLVFNNNGAQNITIQKLYVCVEE